MLPIVTNMSGTCTMDSFVHCRNLDVGIQDKQLLESARNIAREMYRKDEPNPYSMVNLFTWLKKKGSVRYRSETKHPTIGDIVIVPAEAYRYVEEGEPPIFHAMCIYDIVNGEHKVFRADNLYDVFEYNENWLYYTFR